MGVEDAEINRIITQLDYVRNGKINYTEFLAATLREELTEEMLKRLFNKFDVDNSGLITTENLIEAFKRLGHSDITLEEVAQMIKTHDIDRNGVVSFEEFKKIFEED